MNLKLLKKIISSNEKDLIYLILDFLYKRGYRHIEKTDMYIMAAGELPICLCAHYDTVFDRPPQNIFYDSQASVMWSPEGLGADDRAGIFTILSLVEKGYKPHIIFTNLEERGGIGANTLVTKYPHCPFKNCTAIIELDRQGVDEAVFYDCNNKKFTEKILSYDFKHEWGTFSDISIIAPKWGIAAVNLSIGYFNEHFRYEFLYVSGLYRTFRKVEKILEDCKEWKRYKYIQRKSYFGTGWDTSGIPWWEHEICICCGKNLSDKEGRVIATTGKPEDDILLCDECYQTYYGSYAY